MKSTFRFSGFSIAIDSEWRDITDCLDSPDAPATLAKVDGVGALQFSLAAYRGGNIPSANAEDLLSMVYEFAATRGLRDSRDETVNGGRPVYAGASFRASGDFVRVWYVSDGKSFLLVTYVCTWESQTEEIQECEEAVPSVTFSC